MDNNWKAPYLIPISKKFLEEHNILAHSEGTLKTYWRQGKHPEWFAKIGGKVFLDVKAYFDSAKRKEK